MDRPSRCLFAVAGALVGIGLVMVFSASSYRSVYVQGTPYLWFGRQLCWAAVAAGLFVPCYLIDYRRILRLYLPFFCATVAGLCMVFVPPVGRTYNEASRWICLGGIVVQPSEIAKLAVVICTAGFLGSRRHHMHDFFKTFVPFMLGVSAYFILVLIEPDLGTAVFLFTLALLLALVAGMSVWYVAVAGLLASPAFAMFAVVKWAKIVERLKGLFNPASKYQMYQSLVALGSGGLWGKGLGMSTQKFGFLPEPFTDFIFSVVGEELGFFGCLAVMALFAAYLVCGVRVALGARDLSGFLLAFGSTFCVGFQAVMNMAVVTGSAPTKGISLPFISYGGSGLVLALVATALIGNVARVSGRAAGRKEEPAEEFSTPEADSAAESERNAPEGLSESSAAREVGAAEQKEGGTERASPCEPEPQTPEREPEKEEREAEAVNAAGEKTSPVSDGTERKRARKILRIYR